MYAVQLNAGMSSIATTPSPASIQALGGKVVRGSRIHTFGRWRTKAELNPFGSSIYSIACLIEMPTIIALCSDHSMVCYTVVYPTLM